MFIIAIIKVSSLINNVDNTHHIFLVLPSLLYIFLPFSHISRNAPVNWNKKYFCSFWPQKQQTNEPTPPPLLYIFVRKNIIQNISTTYASSQSHSTTIKKNNCELCFYRMHSLCIEVYYLYAEIKRVPTTYIHNTIKCSLFSTLEFWHEKWVCRFCFYVFSQVWNVIFFTQL